MKARVAESLKCVDLFCGPGGLSEGLRQAGIKTVYAVDRDAAAVETFRKNHPEAEVVQCDIEELASDDLPDCDILVGGPPCIEFSTSKGSRANILDGLRLVQAFLRIVHARKPRYWIMENVPRVVLHLPDHIPLQWIGVDSDGFLPVPVRAEFNTADYGVPQVRRRFLMGNFPLPQPTHKEPETIRSLFVSFDERSSWVTLRRVVESFPPPTSGQSHGIVTDPVYGFTLPVAQVSDHFHEVILTKEEVLRIREVKTMHPYMGKMAFPDELDRPARTVVATQLGRETLVLACRNGDREAFRRASVRECAALQGFPITYQFWAGSLNARYRLAGDAVPPPLSFAIGQEIVKAERGIAPTPLVREEVLELSPPVELKRRKARKTTFSLERRFTRMVPGKEVRGCRVDLDNCGPAPSQAVFQPTGCLNLVQWVARLYVGEGKKVMQQRVFSLAEAIWEFAGDCLTAGEVARQQSRHFLEEAHRELAGTIPDATTLQAAWARRTNKVPGPESVVDRLSDLVNRQFPAQDFADRRVPRSGRFDLVPPRGLRVRIAAGLVVTALACEIINSDGRWAAREASKRYALEGWQRASEGSDVPMVAPPTDLLESALRGRRLSNHVKEAAG